MKVEDSRRVPFHRSIAWRMAISAAGLIIFSAALVGFLQYQKHVASWEEYERDRLDSALQISSMTLLNSVDTARRQVLAIAGTPTIQRIISAVHFGGVDPFSGDREDVWRERLAQIFVSVARSHPEMSQLRLVRASDNGKEYLRVNQKAGKITIVPRSELQEKGDRGYFNKTLRLPAGQVLLDGIDLNQENGKIEIPKVPMLRIATPVFSETDEIFGLIIVNVEMKPIFEQMRRSLPAGRSFFVTNENGDYLVHPDDTKTFAFEFGRQERLQDDFPEIKTLYEGQGQAPMLVSWFQDTNGMNLATSLKVQFDLYDPERYLVLVALSPLESLFVEDSGSRNQIIAISGGLAIAGALLAVLSASLITRPLRHLTQIAQKLSQDPNLDEVAFPSHRGDEVGALRSSFLEMTNAVQVRQRKLEEREHFIREILESVFSPIIVINDRGIIQEANPATSKLFGYPEEELIGSNVSMLMPEGDRERHDMYLANYKETGHANIIGVGRELLAQGRLGQTIPVHIVVSEFRQEGTCYLVGILTDLSERYKADRLKNEFVSTVSHELRTPLTSIKGSLGLLKAEVVGGLPEQAKPMIKIAYDNCERLVRLVNDILNVEKIESGNMFFSFEKVELCSFLEHMIEANKAYADEFGIKLDIGPMPASAYVEADPDRLAQVLTNLLSNAIKFSPPGETVRVDLELDEFRARISVADHGPGIPVSFRDKIFGKFTQADSSDTRARGGSGLGLAITKAIVERHGGTITFDTEENKGTIFHFTLPLRQDEEEPSGPSEDQKNSPKILICEDDPDVRTLLGLISERMGYQSEFCSNAAEAKTLLAEGQYAAMTLDLVMPGQNGLSLINELRSNPDTEDLPIIVVSAFTDSNSVDAKQLQVTKVDWVKKPIDIAQLRLRLARAVQNFPARPARILQIEDNSDHRQIVANLVDSNVQLDFAPDWKEARRLLKTFDYDLVILDLELPDGRGEDLLPLIKANGVQAPPQVLVFSGMEPPSALFSQVDSFLVKTSASNDVIKKQIHALLSLQSTELAKVTKQSGQFFKTHDGE